MKGFLAIPDGWALAVGYINFKGSGTGQWQEWEKAHRNVTDAIVRLEKDGVKDIEKKRTYLERLKQLRTMLENEKHLGLTQKADELYQSLGFKKVFHESYYFRADEFGVVDNDAYGGLSPKPQNGQKMRWGLAQVLDYAANNMPKNGAQNREFVNAAFSRGAEVVMGTRAQGHYDEEKNPKYYKRASFNSNWGTRHRAQSYKSFHLENFGTKVTQWTPEYLDVYKKLLR